MLTRKLFENFEKEFEKLSYDIDSKKNKSEKEWQTIAQLDIFEKLNFYIENKQYENAMSVIRNLYYSTQQMIKENTKHLYDKFDLYNCNLSYSDAASISQMLFVSGKHQIAEYRPGQYGPTSHPTGEVITAKMLYNKYDVDILDEIHDKGSAIMWKYKDES